MASSPSAPSAPKTIILAFDGTSNKFGKHKTNLLRLYGLFDKTNVDEQVQYYQPGVGTYLAEGTAWSPTTKAMRETLDSVFAWYLDIHILDGYRFLMKHYKPGDRVCMFGFSRGAYAARCLAGMLNKVGLLPPDNDQMVASAYERYLDTSPDGKELAKDFKEQLGRHCPIEFLGLWDTVSSVGLVTSRHLPFSASNSAVKTVRHALALDERRTKFRHNPWYGSAKPRQSLREAATSALRSIPGVSIFFPLPPRPEDIHAVDHESQSHSTDVREVWFAGCHSDVGGGHGDSDILNTISDPSLCWMINQVLLSGVPVRFSIEALTKLRGFKYALANPLPTPPKDTQPNGSTRHINSNLEIVKQLKVELNATSCIHDELKSTWFWWVPEFLFLRNSIFDRSGNSWREIRWPNFGRGRKIWEGDVLVHESVKLRMKGGSYRPMATFGRTNPHVQYVDDSGENMGEGNVVEGRLSPEKVRGANRRRSSDEEEVPPQKSRRSFWSIASVCVAIPLGIYAACRIGTHYSHTYSPPIDGRQRGRQSREKAFMSQRQSLGNSKRPLSAIFIGDLSNSSDSHSQSQLPSPPSTQGSGDGSLRGKPRQQMHDERPESRASQSRRRDSSDEDDDMRHRDDEDHTARLSDPRRSLTSSGSRTGSRAGFRRGDDEAAGTDAALHRADNLYARNRQVLDRISAITSHSRLNSPSPRPMPSKSPIPRPPSSAQAQRNNRLSLGTISGSETERDQRRDSMSDEHSTPPQSAGIQSRFDDGYPPADEDYEAEAERGGPSRTLRRSLNGTVSRRRGLDPDSPLFSGAIHAAINDPPTSVRTSPHRTRNPLPLEFRDRPGYSGYDREPSPETSYRNPSRERTADYSPPSPTRNRPESRTEYNARPPSVLGNGRMTGRPSSRASNYLGPSTSTAMTPSNSGMTTSSSNRSNVGRFATVRERGSHNRWASEDVHSPDDYPGDRSRGDVSLNDSRGEGDQPPRWRYQSRGGSAESALGHRLVGDSLRAAGLTKRRESSPPRRGEDLFSANGDRSGREDKGKDREPFPRIESSGSSSAVSVITTRSQESEMRRERLSRLPGMERVVSADPRTPYNRENSRGPPVTASRTGSSGGPARPATSIDPQYYENQPRTAPPPLRSYRSYAATDRDRVPPSASRTSYASPVALRPYDEEREEKERLSIPPKPGSALRRLNTASPAPDHARLLQEAFRAFEGNVRRAGPSIHPNAASGCVNAADTLVKAASILNSLLRSNADRAMEELVEAEVDDEGRAAEAELWRRIGAEFRESAKVSDEIIRTMTAFLLDVGRVMRDAASVTASSSGRGTPPASSSSTVFPPSSAGLHHAGSNGHLRTMSLDEEALAMRRAESNSADGRSSLAGSGSGFSAGARARQSVDGGSVSSSSRRSMDRGGGSGSGRLSSEFGEMGNRDSRRSLDGRESGSLRRLASRRTESGQFDQARPPPSAYDHQRLATYDQQRASTSMSMSRSAGTQSSDRERERREYDSPLARDVPEDDVPDPTPSKPAKPSVLSSLANRRLFPSRRPQTSPANAKPPPLVRTSTDVNTPSPQGRNGVSPRIGDEERRRRFPSLAIPPPLSTLPSESHLERRLTPRSASGQGPDLSRKKTSTGSTATVTMRAGGARFPSLTSPSKPTTQVTPTTVSTASDREFDGRTMNRSSQQQPADRAYHHDSHGTRASNAATISGAASRQFSGEREQRQRTLSALSASDAPIREDSGEYDELLAGSTSTIVGRRSQDARPDSGRYATTRGSDRDRHNRRRTVGEIFR